VRLQLWALAIVACVGAAFAVAHLFELSAAHIAVLAPVIVLGAAAVAGLALLWTRVAWESLKHARHPWRIVAAGVAGLVALALLTFLGIKLPAE
jgi:hypothetical protein